MQHRAQIFWLLLITSSNVVTGQGCKPYEQYAKHTMCIYQAKACQPSLQLVKSDGFNEKQIERIVNIHNKLRQNIVAGLVKKAPKAVSMKKLTWDKELATIAQRAADQCKFAHDAERRVSRFYVGQNIFISMRKPVERDKNPNVTQAILSWFNEVNKPGFSAKFIKPFQAVDGAGHYTQIAWADTMTIGCGYTMFIEKGWSKKLIFCNYGPGGNIIGGTMYDVK